MDYIDLLKEQCPPAIVEYVVNSSMTSDAKDPWPNGDFFGPDIADTCHVAALLYRSSVLPPNVGYRTADYLASDTLDYFEKVPAGDRPVLIGAVRQLAARDTLPLRFYSVITKHRIDVRDILKARYPDLPKSEFATPEAHFEAYAYLRYLTAMGDTNALPRLIEALAQERAPSVVSMQLGQIRKLDLPQKDKVFQAFINDTRQSLSPNGAPGLVIANTVRRYLGLPQHAGPYQPQDHKGRPVQP